MELPGTLENQKLEWKAGALNNYFSTPFQSPEFFDFFNSVEGQSAKQYTVESDGVIKAMCLVTFQKEKGLKGYFSRRAIIYGGPLVSEGDSVSLTELLREIYKELRGKV